MCIATFRDGSEYGGIPGEGIDSCCDSRIFRWFWKFHLSPIDCLTGDAVWEAGRKNVYSMKLLQAALKVCKKRRQADKPLKESVRSPAAFIIRYRDGLKASVLMLNGTAAEFSVAWQAKNDASVKATLFALQDPRPYMHFTYLVKGIERMMHTGRPTWPVERTLLTTTVLDFAMHSLAAKGKKLESPALRITYKPPKDSGFFRGRYTDAG